MPPRPHGIWSHAFWGKDTYGMPSIGATKDGGCSSGPDQGFLKGGILPKREPILWPFWGTGTLNNYQMTEGMFVWVESRRNNLAEGKPGGNVAHSLARPQTGRRRIQAKVHTIDPMCEAVRLLDGPAPRWSQQRKPGIQRLQDSQMHEEDDCNLEP